MPLGWMSIIGVTNDPDERVDSVNAPLSGIYCSHQCYESSLHTTAFANHSRIFETPLAPDVVRETREMQATRIGLTVLDIIDALCASGAIDVGALIPLTQEYEALPQTFALTVIAVRDEDLPQETQEGEEDA